MLNKEIKDKINSARDTLVGVLPLPSDQIELITISLIYKFMDDQDEELRKVGLKVKFFTNELKEFSWQQLMSNQLSADARVNKFISGMDAIQKAKHIPALFTEVFNNSFLKFRDGKVLQRFLDIIDGFKYDHSEELGNAFEYLLMTMGAQGDNGQFRTPRNIIDFIVEVVDPKKDETILDPACGTGGFLVSAFKHILRTNTKGYEDYRISLQNYEITGIPITWGDKLTSTEKNAIEKNIVGYDNTPLMVRLAMVNLYLHHFGNPKIHIYNTLTNEARWKEKYDCILANPPFMTPKGGIDTHDKFHIPANRTEVLFASYILQHLEYDGKAGFVVPEGIIFQSSGDYVALRKWMIYEMGLWAVVSLPAQVFQPYSGVKTSILLIDRDIARKRKEILLVKVDNDGFSLNTNRSPIKANDLPEALEWLELCKNNPEQFLKDLESKKDNSFVKKIKFLHLDEFARLDSYKATSTVYNFCKKLLEKINKDAENLQGLKDLEGLKLKKEKNKEKIKKSEEAVKKAEEKFEKLQNEFFAKTGLTFLPKDEADLKEWFEEYLKNEVIEYGVNLNPTSNLSKDIMNLLDAQRDYNLSIDRYSGNEKVQQSHFEMVSLQDICEIKKGSSITKKDTTNGKYPVIAGGQQPAYFHNEFNRTGEVITVSSSGAYAGFINYFNTPIFASDCTTIQTKEGGIVLCNFLFHLLKSKQDFFYSLQQGGAQPHVYGKDFGLLEIPLPPLSIQQQIVTKIESYQKIIDGAKQVVENYKPEIEIDEGWEMVSLEEVCEIKRGKFSHRPRNEPKFFGGKYPFIQTGDIVRSFGGIVTYTQTLNELGLTVSKLFQPTIVLITIAANIGDTAILNYEACFTDSVVGLIPNEKVNPYYLELIMRTKKQYLNDVAPQSAQKNINVEILREVQIPLPPLAIQQSIVKRIEAEQEMVNSAKGLIAIFEGKIRDEIGKLWKGEYVVEEAGMIAAEE